MNAEWRDECGGDCCVSVKWLIEQAMWQIGWANL